MTAYRTEWLRADVLAGLAVAAIQVPTAIAYAELAGFPPQVGLYASVLPLVAYALLGSSRQLIVWTEADFITAFRSGETPQGALDTVNLTIQDYQMTDEDLRALFLYLQSLPAGQPK